MHKRSYFGIIIVCGGSMFVDFVGEPVPTHGFTSTRTFNKVMNCPVCNTINQLPTKFHPHQQQNFYNPQTMAPSNKNDSTVDSTHKITFKQTSKILIIHQHWPQE